MDDSQLSKLEKIDLHLLHFLQYDFSLSKHPYPDIGLRLGIIKEAALSQIITLQKSGYIRRIGASINSSKIGVVIRPRYF